MLNGISPRGTAKNKEKIIKTGLGLSNNNTPNLFYKKSMENIYCQMSENMII